MNRGANPAMLKVLVIAVRYLLWTRYSTEKMLKDEEYGLFFSKEDDKLNNLIHQIERSPELLEQLRKKSRNIIIEDYAWEKITDQYIELFESMVRDR